MSEKTPITLVQDASNQVVAVRIGGAEFEVMHAGPVVGPGQTNLSLTIRNVEIAYAAATPKDGSAGA